MNFPIVLYGLSCSYISIGKSLSLGRNNSISAIVEVLFQEAEIKLCFIKVLNRADEEVLAQELSIHDDEYKLMKQCLKKQRKERIALDVLQEKLRFKMKSGAQRLKIVVSWSLRTEMLLELASRDFCLNDGHH